MLRGYGGKKLKGPKPNWNAIWLLQVKTVNRSLYKGIGYKRRALDRLHPLLDAEGRTVPWDEGKAEPLHALLASLLNTKAKDPRHGTW